MSATGSAIIPHCRRLAFGKLYADARRRSWMLTGARRYMTHFPHSVHNPLTKAMDALYIKGRKLAAGAIQWQGVGRRSRSAPNEGARSLLYIYRVSANRNGSENVSANRKAPENTWQAVIGNSSTYLLLTTKKALVKSVFFIGA